MMLQALAVEGSMRVNVKKWGNSTAVRIPSAVMEDADFRVDDTVDVRAEDGRIVIELVRETDYELSQLLDRITPENLHGSVDFGGPVGKEVL
jgi:antitoxin MazE